MIPLAILFVCCTAVFHLAYACTHSQCSAEELPSRAVGGKGVLLQTRHSKTSTSNVQEPHDSCFATYIQSAACSKSFPRLQSVFGESLELLPSSDVLKYKKASSCAVVSNSPRLLSHKHGHDIDRHDIVIRFNEAQVEGFEEHVGRKTDILILNTQLPQRQPRDLSWLPLGSTHTKVWTNWHDAFPFEDPFHTVDNYVECRRDYPNSSHHLLNANYYKFEEQLLSEARVHASTGFTGVVLALQICDTVDVYEIVPSSAPDDQYHYFGLSSQLLNRSHECACLANTILDLANSEEVEVAERTGYCPHDCGTEHSVLMKYNTLPEDVVNRDGVVRLSAAHNPELQFCKS